MLGNISGQLRKGQVEGENKKRVDRRSLQVNTSVLRLGTPIIPACPAGGVRGTVPPPTGQKVLTGLEVSPYSTASGPIAESIGTQAESIEGEGPGWVKKLGEEIRVFCVGLTVGSALHKCRSFGHTKPRDATSCTARSQPCEKES